MVISILYHALCYVMVITILYHAPYNVMVITILYHALCYVMVITILCIHIKLLFVIYIRLLHVCCISNYCTIVLLLYMYRPVHVAAVQGDVIVVRKILSLMSTGGISINTTNKLKQVL